MCKWSTNTTTGAPLLLLAGSTGRIRVIDCNLRKVVWVSLRLTVHIPHALQHLTVAALPSAKMASLGQHNCSGWLDIA